MKSIVWLRSDLRIEDNPALKSACISSKEVQAVYIFSKKHEGKKEIFSDSYINTFLKENFNFNLIK